MKLSYSKRVSFHDLDLHTHDSELSDEVMVASQLPQLQDTIQNSLKRSQSFPRSATPVPPTGLNFGDFVEDYEMMEGNSILDLGNAPPLFQAEQDMELDIAPNGEKRKT